MIVEWRWKSEMRGGLSFSWYTRVLRWTWIAHWERRNVRNRRRKAIGNRRGFHWRYIAAFRTKLQNLAKVNHSRFERHHLRYFAKTQFLKLSPWNVNLRNEIRWRFRLIRRRFWRRLAAKYGQISRRKWRVLVWRKSFRRKSVLIHPTKFTRVFQTSHFSSVNNRRRRLDYWWTSPAPFQLTVKRKKTMGEAISNLCRVSW